MILLYVTRKDPETVYELKQLPDIAADISIPSMSWTWRGLEKSIPFHHLLGAKTAPEQVYPLLCSYFSQQRLQYLHQRLLVTMNASVSRGTFIEVTRFFFVFSFLLFNCFFLIDRTQ